MLDFVPLPNFPNYWIAHSPPRLIHTKNNQVYSCKQTPNSKKDPYWSVTLQKADGSFVKRNMHRLLLETFVPNPSNKAHVNHIDGDKSNNALTNLEWATEKENAQHAVNLGLVNKDQNKKQVHQYLLNGTYVASYDSDVQAEAQTFIARQNISKVTLGLREHAGYFQWSRIKADSLSPVLRPYIKGYLFQNQFFDTLTDIAALLGYSHCPIKGAAKNRFKKGHREQIQDQYYD